MSNKLSKKVNDLLIKVEKVKFLHYDIFCKKNSKAINNLVKKGKCSIEKLEMLLEVAIFNYARKECRYILEQKKKGIIIYANQIPNPGFLAYAILTKKCFNDDELKKIPFISGDTSMNFPEKYGGYRNWPAELRSQLLVPTLIKGKCEPLSPLHQD